MHIRSSYLAACVLGVGIGLGFSSCDTDPNVMYDLKEQLKGTPDQMSSYHHPWDKNWQGPPPATSPAATPSTNP